MRILRPLVYSPLDARDGPLLDVTFALALRPGSFFHTRWVDTNKPDPVERESDGGAVALDDPGPLESVAHDGQGPRPGVIGAPEEEEGVEDIVIRVQGEGVLEDARG